MANPSGANQHGDRNLLFSRPPDPKEMSHFVSFRSNVNGTGEGTGQYGKRVRVEDCDPDEYME